MDSMGVLSIFKEFLVWRTAVDILLIATGSPKNA